MNEPKDDSTRCAACKIPINERMSAAVDSFHKLTALDGFSKLPQRVQDSAYRRAIKADKALTKVYDAINEELANMMDSAD